MKKVLMLLTVGTCFGVLLSLVGVEMVEHTSGIEFYKTRMESGKIE